MSRPDLQPVRIRLKLLQALPQRLRADLHRPGDLRGPLEQIGPPDIADEHEVAGHGRDRLIRDGAIGDQKGEVFGRVSGRVQHVDRDVADRDPIAVLQFAIVLELILPVRIAFVGQTKPGARPAAPVRGSPRRSPRGCGFR